MSFRKSHNVTDRWRTFCAKHALYVSQLPRLASLFSSSDRFDQFLQTGVHSDGDTMLTIDSMTDEEWPLFSLFVDRYSIDWQSYFTTTQYIGYFRERDRRHWHPVTAPFVRDDLQYARLVVHFWAKWDAIDRNMDANLRGATVRFNRFVQFRSLDIDVPEFHDVSRAANVGNVPALVFYASGRVDRLLVGVRTPEVIVNEIETWLAAA